MTTSRFESPDSTAHEYIVCPRCGEVNAVPRTRKALKFICEHCRSEYYNHLPPTKEQRRHKYTMFAIGCAVIVAILMLIEFSARNDPRTPMAKNPTGVRKSTPPESSDKGRNPGNWKTISYAGLVDGTTITHNGETVAEVVRKIPDYDESVKGLVQQYLEPYSVLCNDVLLATVSADTLPFINITSHYPVGSDQPAWVALFSEGHYQLYYNTQIVRLFVKGVEPARSFQYYHSVVRHAIQDAISRSPTSTNRLEVYAFSNDYSSMTVRVNIDPAVYSLDSLDLSGRRKPVDLASIDNFLQEGVMLEAVEVDEDNDLYFYGKRAPTQTIAGSPLSLSDIAVIYRSIFHYGHNAPYISLDTHEDNRFAKVNFGGHLENTRVGQVVLEADKLFKTLGTGIDPNTHEMAQSRISRVVPGFLTEDERSLLSNSR